MLYVYILAAGGLTFFFCDMIGVLIFGVAAGYVFIPIAGVVAYIYEHDVVTSLIIGSWRWLAGIPSGQDVIFTGNICPDGSYAHPSPSFGLVILAIVQLPVIVAFFIFVFAPCLLLSLPWALGIVGMSGHTLVKRDTEGIKTASQWLMFGMGALIIIGLVLRLIYHLTLLEAGC